MVDVVRSWETETVYALIRAAVIFVVVAVLARLLLVLADRYLWKLTRRSRSTFDDVLFNAVRGPLFWLVLVMGAKVALLSLDFLADEWQALFDGLIFTAGVLVVYVLMYSLVRDLLQWYVKHVADRTESTLDELLIPYVRRVLLVVLTVLAALTILDHFGVEVTTLLATLGVGSLAVALAAQATLRDAISGLVILLDRPYRIGDRVLLPSQEIYGDVIDIGLRSTRIRTRDHRVVTIPNSAMTDGVIINYAYPDDRLRMDLPVGVAYGTDLDRAREVLLEAVHAVEGVLKEPPPRVLVRGFGDSAVNLSIRFWIDSFVNRTPVMDRVYRAAYLALNNAGIEIPFPQRTVWHRLEAQHAARWQQVLSPKAIEEDGAELP
ncbi:MAG: mechanosensitive ion channel family protein [Ardenticatenia bacterium]|nr:mechanosensitive ion channel family protein [Ardenticatenia bacterium]